MMRKKSRMLSQQPRIKRMCTRSRMMGMMRVVRWGWLHPRQSWMMMWLRRCRCGSSSSKIQHSWRIRREMWWKSSIIITIPWVVHFWGMVRGVSSPWGEERQWTLIVGLLCTTWRGRSCCCTGRSRIWIDWSRSIVISSITNGIIAAEIVIEMMEMEVIIIIIITTWGWWRRGGRATSSHAPTTARTSIASMSCPLTIVVIMIKETATIQVMVMEETFHRWDFRRRRGRGGCLRTRSTWRELKNWFTIICRSSCSCCGTSNDGVNWESNFRPVSCRQFRRRWCQRHHNIFLWD